MSLTRKEWEEMWEMTQRLELYVSDLPPHIGFKKFLKEYIRFMKNKIQQVIGQME
jgi:hypothetical protein